MKIINYLLITLLAIIFSCTPKVYVEALKPAKYDVADIKRVAVFDFDGPRASGKTIAALFTDKLWKTQYFTIIERQEIEKILDEHAFNMSGAVDDSTIAEFGRLLGVDAIIVGNVNSYNLSDKRGTEKVKKKVHTGEYEKDKNGKFIYEKDIFGKKHKKKIYKEVIVDQQYILREATVDLSYRMVEIKTAQIRASDQGKKSFSKKFTKNISRIPPKDDILANLSNNVVAQFIPGLTPHRIQLRKTLEKGNDAVNLGIDYAKNGLWDDAIAVWKEEVQSRPDNAQAHYNLGLAYEVKGQIERAEQEYRAAMKIKPKDLYMKAVSGIQKRKKEKIKLDKQLRLKKPVEETEEQ